MSGEAGGNRRVVAAEEACDLEEAVMAFRVVAQEPPDLLARARDALCSRSTEKQGARDAPATADVVDKGKQVADSEFLDDVVGHRVNPGHQGSASA